MAAAPWNPRDSLPVRMVAGPLYRSRVVEDSAGWKVTIAAKLPKDSHTGYGILVADGRGNNHGILMFDGSVVPGAIVIGTVVMDNAKFPLIGVRMSSKSIEDPDCPIFGATPN